MTKHNKPVIVNVFILTLITVVLWVAYSIYQALIKPSDIAVPPQALENFDTRLDAEALTKLQQSIYLTENELVESASEIVIPEAEFEIQTDDEEIPANEETQP